MNQGLKWLNIGLVISLVGAGSLIWRLNAQGSPRQVILDPELLFLPETAQIKNFALLEQALPAFQNQEIIITTSLPKSLDLAHLRAKVVRDHLVQRYQVPASQCWLVGVEQPNQPPRLEIRLEN
ncbi:MAG: hypothetical protein SFT94_05345 [Pseudanabaenaceae cyanobacterium bins.68]|nr:hypothetical protein [Pseudanabaenaceae cyanobacterium bins.68]